MNIELNKTKTLTPSARIGTAIQQDGQWQLIDSLHPDSRGDGWIWTAHCHEVTEEEAAVANAPRDADAILAEQALLLPLLDGLQQDDRAEAQAEIDVTAAAIAAEDLESAEIAEAAAQAIVRERQIGLVGE